MSGSRSLNLGLSCITFLTLLTGIGCHAAEFSENLSAGPVHVTTAASGSENGTAQLLQAAPAASSRPLKGSISSHEAEPAPSTASPAIQVTLSAPHTTTSWDDRDPDRRQFELPLLYLHRQREAAPRAERTLEVSMVGLAGDTEIELEAISRHVDKSTGERHDLGARFVLPDDPCTVRWTFDAATTLSDFYTLYVRDDAGQALWSNPYPERPDFVALDTWDTNIDDYVVRVYYATLFPFSRSELDLDNRLSPAAVTDFIEYVFVPLIVDTWQTQFHQWGFGESIHPAWDRDKVVEIIVTYAPFALFDGSGPYTAFIDRQGNPYPERRIWWPSTVNNYYPYDLLANAYKVTFAHEFFHLAQWNVLLSTGRPTNYWLRFFIEGQGGFAPSAQYPDIEIGGRHVIRDVSEGRAANRFLTQRLNGSYRDLEAEKIHKYDAGLYWRFLYEQFGSMAIIRAALEEMALHREPDIVASLPQVMDRAFARLDGPFPTFEESLVAFARANYALRLENGRCASADLAQCGGRYYDPKGVYVDPPLEAQLVYTGARQTYSGAIPVSYGMDFIKVDLDPALRGRPLTIEFHGAGAVARFNVQVWKLGPGEAKPAAVTLNPEIVPHNAGGSGVLIYAIPQVDMTAYDRLVLIITRLDSGETDDPVGDYTITLDSQA